MYTYTHIIREWASACSSVIADESYPRSRVHCVIGAIAIFLYISFSFYFFCFLAYTALFLLFTLKFFFSFWGTKKSKWRTLLLRIIYLMCVSNRCQYKHIIYTLHFWVLTRKLCILRNFHGLNEIYYFMIRYIAARNH